MDKHTYTVDELVEVVERLNPAQAFRHTNGNVIRLCTTGVITRMVVGGEVRKLELVDGRYCSGYIRVSTERQSDGFSIPDQAERIIHRCIKNGWAFRIFSDAGLSGGLAYRDPETNIEAKLNKAKADRYRDVFTAVLLEDHAGRYTPAELASMRRYMEERVRELAEGKELDRDGTTYRQREQKRVTYRPALTCLVEALPAVHTLLVTDLSRLSRSETLIAEIHYRLHGHGVTVEGILTDLSWMHQKGVAGKLLRTVFASMDETKLTEVLLGDMRGLLASLNVSKPVGKIPTWLHRDAHGFAQLHPVRSQAIKRLVELYLAAPADGQEVVSFNQVAVRLAEEGYPSPDAATRGKHWTWRTVADILRNPAVNGKQMMFGKAWDVFPKLLDDEEYWLLQRRLAKHDQVKPIYKLKNEEGYLMQGLLKCHCGRIMGHWAKSPTDHKYICRVETAQKKEERKRDGYKPHAVLLMADVDDFFDNLMEHYQADVFALYEDANDARRHREELQQLEREAQTRREALFRAEKERRKDAEDHVRTIMDETESDFAEWVEKALAKFTRREREAEAEIVKRVQDKRRQLEALIPTADLERRAKNWNELSMQEKNRLLRSIYDCLEFVGDPPNEALKPVLKVAYPFPTPNIHLVTEVRKTQFRRRMPAVDNWVMQLKGEHKGRVAAYREWHAKYAAAKAGDPYSRALMHELDERERAQADLEDS